MIGTIDANEVNKKLEEFYSKPYYLSYSGLNKLLYSPGLFFRHYILQEEEEKLESYLVEGKVIHCLLLDDGSFSDKFILMTGSIPTANTKTVIDRIHKIYQAEFDAGVDRAADGVLANYGPEAIMILKEIGVHQSLADDKKPGKDGRTLTGDQKRIEKVFTDESRAYWEFLKIKGKKDIIDNDMLQSCAEAVEILRADNQICELMGLFINEMENVKVYNEQYYQVETDKNFGVKGYPDNIKVDYDKKIIFINDLKKTSKTLTDFPEAIEVFNYWAQAAIYYRLVLYNFSDIITDEWKIVFNFVVIDRYQQVYPFEVSADTMQSWQIRLEEKLNEADWHYVNKNYKLPYQFANGKVIL